MAGEGERWEDRARKQAPAAFNRWSSINYVAQLYRALAAAQAKVVRMSMRNADLPRGASSATVSISGARWTRALEARDRIEKTIAETRARERLP